MAVITVNYILGTESNVVDSSRPDFFGLTRPHYEYIGEAYDKYGEIRGDVTETLPIDANGVSVPVNHIMGYETLFYYRIRIEPSRLDFGNVLSPKTDTIYVWNAYFTAQTLNDVVETSLDGVTLTEPFATPTSFSALEAREYTVEVSNTGTPSISGSYTFDFASDTITIPVTAQRVVIWPFMAQTQHTDSLEFSTNVMRSYNREQRMARRPIPRRRLGYSFWLSKRAFSRARIISQEWAHRVYGVPVWSEGAKVGALSSGATSITIDTTNSDFRADGLALVWDDDETFEAVEITTVNSGSLALTGSLGGDYSNAYVCPIVLGRTPSGVQFNRTAHDYLQSQIEFLVIDNVDLSDTSPYPQYRGYDVLTDNRVVIGDLSESIARQIDIIDNGVNLHYDTVESRSRYRQMMTWHLNGQSEVFALQKWLHRIKGKQKPFWLPTYNADLALASTIGAASLSITVTDVDYSLYLGTTDIMIQLTDGTRFYRRVSGATPSGANETLSIDAQLGQEVTPAEVQFICFMNLVRFDSDVIEFDREYINARVAVPVIPVNQDE